MSSLRRPSAVGSAALMLATAALIPVSGAQALGRLTTGFSDDEAFLSPSPPVRAEWLGRAVDEHAGIVRLDLLWSEVARQAPAGDAQASDPSWAGYDWSRLDAAIGDATARDLQVLITVRNAPRWAEGPGRPASAPSGTWMPRPDALGAFAQAAALRYSGTYTPPGASTPLPWVRYWQAWNEPNLSLYLTPQWRRVARGYLAVSPSIYRAMLDAFYTAVHGVQSSDQVLSGGTAPYGDTPGGQRMPPAQFVRELLCLSGPRLIPEHCPNPARFDILDHHPYSVEGPSFHAFNRDDVAIVDLGKLTVPLRRAERLHLVADAIHHQMWVTETSWDSDPPDPQGVPAATQARWLQEAFYLLWRQGVSAVLWYLIVDAPPIPSYASTYQSGTYLRHGRAKPSARAFRFPFVALRQSRETLLVWGEAPAPGAIRIERKAGSAWRLLGTLSPAPGGVFQARLSLRGGALLRARQGGDTSLGWRTPA